MSEANSMAGPLAGIRVLDLGTVVAAPFAATLLADFGADVIKVELPGRGDTLRQLGPTRAGTSLWFAADGRNKRSITLDLRKPAGNDLLLRLAPLSDVLIENFIPGTLDGWGITGEALRGVNPGLIIMRASGFGQTGPYRTRPGYDRVGAAYSGLWNLTGRPDGEPMRPGVSLHDYMTGSYGAFGIMMALFHREARGGKGQEIDVSLFESGFRAMEYTAVQYALDGVVRQRVGNGGPAMPAGAYRTRDERWLVIAVAENAMYQRLMRAIGRDDLAGEPEFATAPGRMANSQPIDEAIAAWAATLDLDAAMAVLNGAEIAAGPGLNIADIFADPQYAARDALVPVEDPALGPIKIQGITPKLSETPGAIRRPAPLLGQHNAEVYRGLLNLSDEDLAALQRDGVI